MSQTKNQNASGLEQLQAWIARARELAIGETLKFTLKEISEGRAVFEATPGRHVYNPIGSVHGGYAATLLDSAVAADRKVSEFASADIARNFPATGNAR